MKVLALDFGSARTGVAVSDPTGTLARPLGVVERATSDSGLDELASLVRIRQEARDRRVAEQITLPIAEPVVAGPSRRRRR